MEQVSFHTVTMETPRAPMILFGRTRFARMFFCKRKGSFSDWQNDMRAPYLTLRATPLAFPKTDVGRQGARQIFQGVKMHRPEI